MFNVNAPGAVARRGLVAAAVAMVAVGVAACGSDDNSSTTPAASNAAATTGSTDTAKSGSAAGKTVYFLGCGPQTPYCAVQNREMKKGLEAAGIKAIIQDNGAYDVAVQTKQLNSAVAQKPDLIAGVFVVQQPLRPALMKAKQQNVPVLAFNTPIAKGFEDIFAGHVGQSDFDEGKIGGDLMLRGLKEAGHAKGRLLILSGGQGDQAAEGRENGFKEAVSADPAFEVTVSYSNWLPTKSATDTQQMLAKYKDIVGIFGANSSQAAAAIKAAEGAGAKTGGADGIVVTGGNCDPSAQDYIRDGKLYGNNAQSPFTDVETEVKVIVDYLSGGDLPKETPVPMPEVTKANVDQFQKVCTF
jgi:ribose transport system substrate-binding protein